MRNIKTTTLAGLTLATVLGLGFANPTSADEHGDDKKVTICHAAGREGTDQFVTITVSVNAVYGPGGHFNENGTTQAGHEEDYFGECETPPTTVPETTVPETTVPETTVPETTVPETTTPATTTVTPTTGVTPTTAAPTVSVGTAPTPPPAATNRSLPTTGSTTGLIALLAATTLGAGAGITALSRRKTTSN